MLCETWVIRVVLDTKFHERTHSRQRTPARLITGWRERRYDCLASTNQLPDLRSVARRPVWRAGILSSTVGIPEAAERFEVTRVTVDAWIAAKRLLAWQATRRGVLLPAEQIMKSGEVAPAQAIGQVLAVIPDPAVAWDFLTEVGRMAGGDPWCPAASDQRTQGGRRGGGHARSPILH